MKKNCFLLKNFVSRTALLLIALTTFLISTSYAAELDKSESDTNDYEVRQADIKARRERFRSALLIAHEYARTALMNPRYTRVIRPSSVPEGPADIRLVLQRFLNETSDDPKQSRIVFDGSARSSAACIKNPWGSVIIGDSKIYICPKGLTIPDRILAEVIIHEFVHSIGYQTLPQGECQATEVSMSAIIASGHNPYGNVYTVSESCKNMTDAQRSLARELWSKGEHPNDIKPGFKITFMSDVLSRIQSDVQNKHDFIMRNASGNILNFSEVGRKGSIPKEPFTVKENLSDSQIVLILQDANSNMYRFVIATGSQVPLPISFLKTFGIGILQ